MADILTEQGSKREALEEVTKENIFEHALDKNNLVKYANDEILIKNLTIKLTIGLFLKVNVTIP